MAQPRPITITSVRPALLSWSMSSTTGTCQVCGGGGVAAPSLVMVTWISKQYWFLGQSGVILHTRDCDGECDEVLHDVSVSLGPFQPFGGVRVWPCVWAVAWDLWWSRLLDWMAIDTEMSTLSWNCWIRPFRLGTKAYARKLRNDGTCASHILFTVG